MHFPTTASTTLLTALLTLTTLTPLAAAGVAVLPRHPQNDNRPVPTGECCVPNTSLKQDTCTAASGATGRCVPGGNDCKSLSFSLSLLFGVAAGLLRYT